MIYARCGESREEHERAFAGRGRWGGKLYEYRCPDGKGEYERQN